MALEKKHLAYCMFLFWPIACPAAPKGGIEHISAYTAAIKSLAGSGADVPSSKRTFVAMDRKLAGQRIDDLSISAGLYQEVIDKTYVNFRNPHDSFSIECENQLETAISYTTYVPRIQARETDASKYKLKLRDGECISLQRKGMDVVLGSYNIDVLVGIYNFDTPLSKQVPNAERVQRLGQSLEWYNEVWGSTRLGSSIQAYQNVLVGEAAGYTFHGYPSPVPHQTLFNINDDNYYRIVFVSNWSIVTIDVVYPLSIPLDKIQNAILPVIKSLNYAAQPD